jgi:Raf kinase inhibitor-like YbhB/YbcL family protein
MRATRLFMTLALVVAVGAGAMIAQDKGGGGKGGGKGKGGPNIPAPITLKIAAYPDGGAITSATGCPMGVSPKIDWTGAPAGAATLALIMHDTDVDIGGDNGPDVLHWAIFNIPATATGLPEKMGNAADLPDGSRQLKNIGGSVGWFSPCPPPPTVHHYIIEVYALDTKLDVPATGTRADLLTAMKGHVRAKGTYTGVYHQ